MNHFVSDSIYTSEGFEQRSLAKQRKCDMKKSTVMPRLDQHNWLFVQRLQEVKMASMIQLASGLAHEINSPLSVVISNIRTLECYFEKMLTMLETSKDILDRCDVSGRRRNAFKEHWRQLDIEEIIHDSGNLLSQSLLESEKIREIIANFKGVTHENHQEVEPVDVNFEIERILSVVASSMPPGTRVKRKYGKFPIWHGNPALFCQTITNILSNAFQSRDRDLRMALKTYYRGNCLEIKISDNGEGISEEIKPHIFEPFFTSREVGQGMGLGLAMAYNFVHRNQGDLRVTSRCGRGTIVTVVLPYLNAAAMPH